MWISISFVVLCFFLSVQGFVRQLAVWRHPLLRLKIKQFENPMLRNNQLTGSIPSTLTFHSSMDLVVHVSETHKGKKRLKILDNIPSMSFTPSAGLPWVFSTTCCIGVAKLVNGTLIKKVRIQLNLLMNP